MANSQVIRGKFVQAIHVLILFFFVWIIFVHFLSPNLLVELHHFLSPAIGALELFFPYVKWLGTISYTPEETRAFVEMIYLCFVMLFLNLLLAIYPVFDGPPTRNYLLSFNGFEDFLEENIFCRLSPSVSLVAPSERLWGRGGRGGQMIEAGSYGQIITVYLRKYAVLYYGGLAFAGFVFFPWVAYNRVNTTSGTAVPFWLAVIVFVYTQIRWIFELVVLLPFLIKAIRDSSVKRGQHRNTF